MDRPKRKSSYVPKPKADPETLDRLDTVILVQSGQLTVSEAARRLGMSRNHFQTLYHRALAAMLEELTPRLGGRPRRNPEMVELRENLTAALADNERLQEQLETQERVIHSLTEMVREASQQTRRRTAGSGHGRAKRATRKAKQPTESSNDEPDRHQRGRYGKARKLKQHGLSWTQAARAVDCSPSTLWRWRRRARRGEPLAWRRGPGRRGPVPGPLRQRVAARVRELRGQIGAEALRRSFAGLSRRQAQRIKNKTATQMERERVAEATRVRVTAPGIVRGFDAMHVSTLAGWRYLLIGADASVPMRTSAAIVEHYDIVAVLRALASDIEQHGAPLVLRFDRWRAHDAKPVTRLLEEHAVLPLHGPPRCPTYYGQLERQNREHRGWLRSVGVLDPNELAGEARRMVAGLNELVPRRILDWQTPKQVWDGRQPVNDDRAALREEVDDYSEQLRRKMDDRAIAIGLDRRLAIERALTKRGHLTCETGGWC